MAENSLTFSERMKNSWNAFRNKDPSPPRDDLEHSWNAFDDDKIEERMYGMPSTGLISTSRPDRFRFHYGTDRTVVTAIYNRLATDVTRARFEHVRVDDNGRFAERIDSGLNYILTQEANIDQSHMSFMEDLVLSMLDEGVVAVVPIDTTVNPKITGSYDIQTMRTGKITGWYPDRVKIEVYNEKIGQKQEIEQYKRNVAIIENPFYSVMNEKSSTLKRLTHKLALLDAIDDQSGSGKLDLIIQLPYVIKSPARKKQAEMRRSEIESQLENSKYGIAYTDGTEHITQLNRSVENNLMTQIEYLTSMLYGQLGLTDEIMNGTASEATMQNYYSRTINVILDAIASEFTRKFLTKTARSQNQRILYFRDPFAFTTASALAELADKLTRNEIFSPNDVRGVIGVKPAEDERADELRNRNISQSADSEAAGVGPVSSEDRLGSYSSE